MNQTGLFYKFLPALLLFSLYCSEKPEKTLLRLETMTASGKTKEVTEEIKSLLKKLEKENSTVIFESKDGVDLKRSLDGSTAVWLKSDDIYFLSDEANSIDIDEEGSAVFLSYDGSHALVKSGDEDNCTLTSVSLKTKEIVRQLKLPSCTNTPAVDSTGSIFFTKNNSIYRASSSKEIPEEEIISGKKFASKYTKISNRIHISSGPDSTLYIFYGNAGYYRLYRYAENQKSPEFIGDNFVKPEFFPVQESDLLNQTVSKKSNGLKGVNALLIYGSAGKYSLKTIQFHNIKSQKNLRAPSSLINLAGADSSGLIYFTENDITYAFNPENNTTAELPFETSFLLPVREGVLYLDSENLLRLRKTSVTAFENKLVEMKNKMEREKKKDD